MTTDQLIELGWKVLGWAVVALLPIGIRWLLSQAARASSDQHNATLALLSKVAVMAVTSAEQTIAANPDKKRAALQFVDNYLRVHGITLPVFEIETAIESAVFSNTVHDVPPASPVGNTSDSTAGDMKYLTERPLGKIA